MIERVSKKSPCGICGRTDWCGEAFDAGHVHAGYICMRVASDKPTRNGGWFHKDTDSKPVAPAEIRRCTKEPSAPPFICDAYLRAFQATTTRQYMDYGLFLGVTAESLSALKAAYITAELWMFPMLDGDGKIIGIRTRHSGNGNKRTLTGSHNGLFYDTEILSKTLEHLLVCEGPTDTAAALSLGFDAVGKADCNSANEHLHVLLKRVKYEELVFIAQADNPALNGIKTFVARYRKPGKIILTPQKDLRKSIHQLTHESIREQISVARRLI